MPELRRQPTIPGLPECLLWDVPGLPEPTKAAMRAWQRGRCAACGIEGRALVEDHDHATGFTRGWLCRPCNSSEGAARRSLMWWWWRNGANPASILGVQAYYVNVRGLTVIKGRKGFVPEDS
ncbi:endonuclease domain-containing protein [Nocardioides sp. BE266]|uniref:endonuclease domain-containing protein n=1 Tax=Nocardioides sp. BE266 TaxID=2817725 RepID=UPI0037C7B690